MSRNQFLAAGALLIAAISPAATNDEQKARIAWLSSYPDAVKEAFSTKKPLLVEFYLKGCGVCQKMDRETLSDPAIIEASRDFVMLRVDVEEDKITPRRLNSGHGTPEFQILGVNSELILKNVGFSDAKEFGDRLETSRRQYVKHREIVKAREAMTQKRYGEVVKTLGNILDRKKEFYLDERDEAAIGEMLELVDKIGNEDLAGAEAFLAKPGLTAEDKLKAVLWLERLVARFAGREPGKKALEIRDRIYADGKEGARIKEESIEFRAAQMAAPAVEQEKKGAYFPAQMMYELVVKDFPETKAGAQAKEKLKAFQEDRAIQEKIAQDKERIANGLLNMAVKAGQEGHYERQQEYLDRVRRDLPETKAAKDAFKPAEKK